MPTSSDTELVQSARSGDEKAFERLVEKHRVRICATVSGFIENPQDREDVVQETFIKAYRNLHQLSKPEHFGSWLDTIAQNQCRDWRRKNRVQTVPIDDLQENLPDRNDSPDQSSVEAEQRRIIAQAIDSLPQTERQLAREHYLEDANHDELVSRHGISYQSVSARLFRAKRKLVKRLRHLLGGVLVPPISMHENISSGGFTAMRFGTAPKITAGVIAIIALAFFGSRQLLSPGEDSSPSVEVTASMPTEPIRLVDQTNNIRESTVTAPLSEDEPQITVEEMEQIEDFFAQLDMTDVQSETDTPQLPTDAEVSQNAAEDDTTESSTMSERTTQSAEDVMSAYVEALKDLDSETMLSLVTSDFRKESRDFWDLFDNSDSDSELNEVLRWAFGQAEVVESKHVGGEFHFRLRVQSPIGLLFEKLPLLEGFLPPEAQRLLEKTPGDIPVLHKMRKEKDAWRIYEF